MKIALFTDTYPPAVNGVAVHVSTLAEALAKQGHSVLVCVPGHSQPPQTASFQFYLFSSVPSLVYPDLRLTTPFSIKCLQVVRDFKPDVIHFHTPGTIGLNGVLIAKRLKVPIIGSFHTYFMEPEYLKLIALDKLHLHENEIIISLGWKISNSIYNKSDYVVTYSESTKLDLIHNGLKPPVKVINNNIHLDTTHIKVSHFTGYKSLPKNYFIYVGRLSKEKSIDKLIESFSQFAQENKTVDLVIVGDGPARSGLEDLTIAKRLDSRIHFLGMVDHSQLVHSDLVSKAIAFVSTSTSEVKPLSVIEAITLGLPIIGVNAKGMPELIQGNGIICEPNDKEAFAEALKTIVKNKELRNQFSKKSKEIAKANSSQETTQTIEEVYQYAIEKFKIAH